MTLGFNADVSPPHEKAHTATRVLVVDDDGSTRSGLGALLRGQGFVVDLARDGAEALRILSKRAPDVILTDLRMPGMSGVELCERLRDIDPDLPVILVTAARDADSVVLGMRAGAQDFLEKPLEAETVIATVLESLERRASRLEKRASQPPPAAPPPEATQRDLLARVASELRSVNERLVVTSLREREHAEEQMRQRAQLDALLRNLSEGVLIADAGGRVRMLNPAGRAALSADGPLDTVEQLASLDIRTIEGAPMDRAARPFARALRGDEFADYEVLRLQPSGESRRLLTTGTSVKSADGRVELAIVVFRDITELRRLERQRAEYAALVSHDLRTPLNSIQLLATTIRRGVPRSPEEIADAAERIQANVARMDAMVQEILEASQLESRTLELRFGRCDLRAIVRGIVARLDDARARRVSVDVEDAAYALRADLRRLERAITNLITNALKYSPESTTVTVTLAREGDQVVLRVIDRGIGIAREHLPRLFDRYYRAPGTSDVEGLGLGLYITRLLVEAHGGRIHVESTPGEGSAFTLILPSTSSAG